MKDNVIGASATVNIDRLRADREAVNALDILGNATDMIQAVEPQSFKSALHNLWLNGLASRTLADGSMWYRITEAGRDALAKLEPTS